MTTRTLTRKIKQCKLALLCINVKNQIFQHVLNLGQDLDLDRHPYGKWDPDPDRHQNDADPQHCF